MSVETLVMASRSSRRAAGWIQRFRARWIRLAMTASRMIGEAICQFDMPAAWATTTSFSRWATFRAPTAAINRAMGRSREIRRGVASRDT
jgi:hypothetical protein